MKTYTLKSVDSNFQAMLNGTKQFDVRIKPCEAEIGDTIRFLEIDPHSSFSEYTGNELLRKVTFIQELDTFVVMSLSTID